MFLHHAGAGLCPKTLEGAGGPQLVLPTVSLHRNAHIKRCAPPEAARNDYSRGERSAPSSRNNSLPESSWKNAPKSSMRPERQDAPGKFAQPKPKTQDKKASAKRPASPVNAPRLSQLSMDEQMDQLIGRVRGPGPASTSKPSSITSQATKSVKPAVTRKSAETTSTKGPSTQRDTSARASSSRSVQKPPQTRASTPRPASPTPDIDLASLNREELWQEVDRAVRVNSRKQQATDKDDGAFAMPGPSTPPAKSSGPPRGFGAPAPAPSAGPRGFGAPVNAPGTPSMPVKHEAATAPTPSFHIFLYATRQEDVQDALRISGLDQHVGITHDIKQAQAVVSAKLTKAGKHVKHVQGERAAKNQGIPFLSVGRVMKASSLRAALQPVLELHRRQKQQQQQQAPQAAGASSQPTAAAAAGAQPWQSSAEAGEDLVGLEDLEDLDDEDLLDLEEGLTDQDLHEHAEHVLQEDMKAMMKDLQAVQPPQEEEGGYAVQAVQPGRAGHTAGSTGPALGLELEVVDGKVSAGPATRSPSPLRS